MASYCDNCGELQYRRQYRDGKFIGTDCGCLHLVNGRNSVADPFAGLTLEHVHDENGKPRTFENMRALSRFEAETGMVHAVLSHSEKWMPNDWQAPTMRDLMRPREHRDHGRMVNTIDGYRVISGNGFTARVRKD